MADLTGARQRLVQQMLDHWKKRADWAASDECPGDFYPQDAFGECIDDLAALSEGEAPETFPSKSVEKRIRIQREAAAIGPPSVAGEAPRGEPSADLERIVAEAVRWLQPHMSKPSSAVVRDACRAYAAVASRGEPAQALDIPMVFKALDGTWTARWPGAVSLHHKTAIEAALVFWPEWANTYTDALIGVRRLVEVEEAGRSPIVPAPPAVSLEPPHLEALARRVVQESSTDIDGRTDGPFYYVSQRDLDALEQGLDAAVSLEPWQPIETAPKADG